MRPRGRAALQCRGRFARALLAAGLALAAFGAAAAELELSLGRIRHPAFSASDVRLAQSPGGGTLAVGALAVGQRRFAGLRLSCRETAWQDGLVRCDGARLAAGSGAPEFVADIAYEPARKRLEVSLRDTPIEGLAALLPELARWRLKGRADGTLRFDAAGMAADLRLTGFAFADDSGAHAAEKADLRIAAQASRAGGGWQWRARLDWAAGAAYWQPLYVEGNGQSLEAEGRLDARGVELGPARLALPGIGTLTGRGRWQRPSGRMEALTLATDRWQLKPAVGRLLRPYLDARGWPALGADGGASLAAEWDAAGLARLDLELDAATLGDAGGRFALDGVRARLPWRRDAATAADIALAGGRVAGIELGGFAVPLAMEGWRFSFGRVAIPVFDGRLLFEDFAAARAGEDWRWQLAGALEPVAMPAVSRALGLPEMGGLLSATIPRIGYADRTLTLDGTLIVAVFDGYLAAQNLRVIDPFGRLPALSGDVEARNIDFGLFTDTFRFGSITGRVDADVRGLELQGGRPVAFDARIASSPGSYPRRISQRAVQNISSLGGAGAGAAIQRTFLRFFETFGYQRIGLGCRLVNGVCLMSGIEEKPPGYLMVQGGGLPSLNIIGYNRAVSWDELVERLKAAVAGNVRPVIR